PGWGSVWPTPCSSTRSRTSSATRFSPTSLRTPSSPARRSDGIPKRGNSPNILLARLPLRQLRSSELYSSSTPGTRTWPRPREELTMSYDDSGGGGGSQIPSWVIYLVIIIVANLILFPLLGIYFIPI